MGRYQPTRDQMTAWRKEKVAVEPCRNTPPSMVYKRLLICERCAYWSAPKGDARQRGACTVTGKQMGRRGSCDDFATDGPGWVAICLGTAAEDGEIRRIIIDGKVHYAANDGVN